MTNRIASMFLLITLTLSGALTLARPAAAIEAQPEPVATAEPVTPEPMPVPTLVAEPVVPSPCDREPVTVWALKYGGSLWLSADPVGQCGDTLHVITSRADCMSEPNRCVTFRFGRGALFVIMFADY